MLRRGEDVSYDVLIEREREKLKLNQQALETTESQMKGSGDIFTALTEAGRMETGPTGSYEGKKGL